MAGEWRLTQEAEDDVADAYAWYENQRSGLGEHFATQLELTMNSVVSMPTMHEMVYKDFRRALLRRFPYAVYYKHDEQTVTVYAILHTSRNPATWRKRLR